MSDTPTGRAAYVARPRVWRRRVLVTAPVVLLSAVWTLALGETASAPAADMYSPVAATPLPVVTETTVPTATIRAPGYAVPPTTTSSVRATAAVARTSTTADIPDAALAAYQRAATVVNATDTTCNLPWQIVAAIGRVESNHGRFAGSTLDADGVATPPIIGVRLDGHGAVGRIRDTDAGQLDGDNQFDRAVGPMQFIPSTWSYVGVDADGDGVRNPQDIDDAALAAGVYLCADKGDLATEAGQRHSIYRYNHSTSYVDLVLSIAESYSTGNFWTVATAGTGGTTGTPTVPITTIPTSPPPGVPTAVPVPVPTAVPVPVPTAEPADPSDDPGDDPGDDADDDAGDDPGEDASNEPSDPADEPTDEPTGGQTTEPSDSPSDEPSNEPAAEPATEPSSVPATPAEQPTEQPAEPAAEPTQAPAPTAADALALCTQVGIDPAGPDGAACVQIALDAVADGQLPSSATLLAMLALAGVALP